MIDNERVTVWEVNLACADEYDVVSLELADATSLAAWFWLTTILAQQAPESTNTAISVPRLIAFNGVLHSRTGQPLTGVVGAIFAVYKDQEGGAPIRTER